MEQNTCFIVKYVACIVEICSNISTVRGYNFLNRTRLNKYMKKGVWPMFVIAVSICLLVFVALAGANLLISDINSDELSNMGIEKKS